MKKNLGKLILAFIVLAQATCLHAHQPYKF